MSRTEIMSVAVVTAVTEVMAAVAIEFRGPPPPSQSGSNLNRQSTQYCIYYYIVSLSGRD
jgi:hypothetical protein